MSIGIMTEGKLTELKYGFETALIDAGVSSNLAYKPQFVSNNYKEGKKVLSSVEDELLLCDQFQISVAFITMSGITPLLQTLKELEKKGHNTPVKRISLIWSYGIHLKL